MAFHSDKDKTLLLAVKHGNAKKVEKLLETNGLTIDENWIDYTLLLTAFKRKHKYIIKLLLEMGCRVKRASKSNVFLIPVYYAVRMRDISILKKLLERGATVYDRSGDKKTPICLAMDDEQFSIVDMLLANYDFENINPEDAGDIDHFLIACKRNMPEVVRNFVEHGVSVNKCIYYGYFNLRGLTPLHIAVRNMCLETVEVLLSRGANITAINYIKCTPLHLANQIRENQRPAGIEAIIDAILLSHRAIYTNPVDHKGVSHFHIACTRDNVEVVRHFLQCGVDINSHCSSNFSTFDYFTALHYAVYYNCARVVELLLSHNANVNACDRNNPTPLHLAAIRGHTEIVAMILKHGKADLHKNFRFRTPLHCAFYSKQKNDAIIDMLLEHVSKKTNAVDNNLLSYFHIACTRTNANVVNEFLNNKVSINSRVALRASEFAGFSALHFAVLFNRKNIVELLLQHNANTNLQVESELTPLHFACIQNLTKFYELIYKYTAELGHRSSTPTIDWLSNRADQLQIVKLLLDRKVDVNSKDLTDRTPLFYAHGFRPNSIKREIENCLDVTVDSALEQIILKELYARRKEIINLLFRHNADVNIPDYRKRTMLYFVSEREEEIDKLVEMAELFLSQGANVNVADDEGITPLHLAVKYRATKLVEVFLKHNANVNCIERFSFNTPLHFAISGKDKLALKEIIKLLVERGANVNAKKINGKTPLHIACLTKNYYAVYELLQYGADINCEDNDGLNALHLNFKVYGYNDKSSIKAELMRHIKKLKVIGFHVSKNVRSLYAKLHQKERRSGNSKAHDNDNDNYVLENENDELVIRCRDELERMKLTKIDNYSSLYSVLFKNPNEMTRHIQNHNLRRILMAADFERHFPLYGYLLKLQYRKGLARSFILKPAKESLEFIIGFKLPDLCYEYILNHLTTTSMESLINCAPTTFPIKRKSSATNSCADDCVSLIKYQRVMKLHSPHAK